MTSYFKSFVGFPLIITEKLKFYRNKHNDLKREITSLREIGGATGMHITLCGNNKSLIKIKKKHFNRHNLEIKCQRHFYTDSICYFQRLHKRT